MSKDWLVRLHNGQNIGAQERNIQVLGEEQQTGVASDAELEESQSVDEPVTGSDIDSPAETGDDTPDDGDGDDDEEDAETEGEVGETEVGTES